jgi:hypothetical protein
MFGPALELLGLALPPSDPELRLFSPALRALVGHCTTIVSPVHVPHFFGLVLRGVLVLVLRLFGSEQL